MLQTPGSNLFQAPIPLKDKVDEKRELTREELLRAPTLIMGETSPGA